jgi:hypothetical protein
MTAQGLVALEDFYAEDPRRRADGSVSFGLDWKDPGFSDPNTFCEVRWYRGTHEIAAVYTTYDIDRLHEIAREGTVSKDVLADIAALTGPAYGGSLSQAASARVLGSFLAERDMAATKTEVRLMGVLAHPLERYWVLRDAYELEVRDDGLTRLQERIDACAQGDRMKVHDHSLWALLGG